jgi:hypothetical protein
MPSGGIESPTPAGLPQQIYELRETAMVYVGLFPSSKTRVSADEAAAVEEMRTTSKFNSTDAYILGINSGLVSEGSTKVR